MAIERTLSIIKPSSVRANHIGAILKKLEDGGLRIIAAKLVRLTRERAANFYAVHHGKPFFNELVDFMSSGPIMVQVLEADNAIARNREIMGATNPAEAAPGTIRAEFADNMTENAVHGSDGPDTASVEINFFFDTTEICVRS